MTRTIAGFHAAVSGPQLQPRLRRVRRLRSIAAAGRPMVRATNLPQGGALRAARFVTAPTTATTMEEATMTAAAASARGVPPRPLPPRPRYGFRTCPADVKAGAMTGVARGGGALAALLQERARARTRATARATPHGYFDPRPPRRRSYRRPHGPRRRRRRSCHRGMACGPRFGRGARPWGWRSCGQRWSPAASTRRRPASRGRRATTRCARGSRLPSGPPPSARTAKSRPARTSPRARQGARLLRRFLDVGPVAPAPTPKLLPETTIRRILKQHSDNGDG